MNQRNILSAYTPSNTDPALLERIFVQRQRLREKLTERLARSATTGDMHHALLIGPRGCGKTNLVTLIEHSLTQRLDLADTMRIAWLGEDDTFADPIHLALAIADQLAKKYSDEFDKEPREAVRGLAPMDAANALLKNIVTQLGDRTLLLITENFDRTLRSFGDSGQKQWRAFLQETGRFATLATAQQLTDDMSSRDKPFFGFFDTHHLEPLSVEDARDLIRNIALVQDKNELATYLDSAEGRYRIRALHHLAGGNHRMYVLLAEFLTRDALDDLVEAFERLAEELTPYFQERLRSLSPQQATLVECLCSQARAMTVKEIAETTFVEERTCSKQLGNLRRKGYVVSQKRGKESYYDMAEPLMRLCLEVKNQRGRPLKTLARFLRAWFPEQKLLTANGHSARTHAYLKAALATDESYNTSIASDLQNQIQWCLEQNRYEEAAGLTDELHYINPSSTNQVAMVLNDSGAAYDEAGDTHKAITDFTRVIKLRNASSDQVARALVNRGLLYGQRSDTKNAIADFTRVIELPNAPPTQVAVALTGRGLLYGQSSDTDRAIADLTGAVELSEAPIDHLARALIGRGIMYARSSHPDRAIADFTHVLELPATTGHLARALNRRGMIYGDKGETEKAIEDFTGVIELPAVPSEHLAHALTGRGLLFAQLSEPAKAIMDFTNVIELADAAAHAVADALRFRGIMYSEAGDIEKAAADFTHVIELPGAPADHVTRALLSRGIVYGEVGNFDEAIADLTRVIERPDASPNQVIQALNNRGAVRAQLGDSETALADFHNVLERPDASPNQVAQALLYRGFEYWGTRDILSARAYRECIATPDASPAIKTSALFALPEPMVATSDIDEVVAALVTAFASGDQDSKEYGGTPRDLLAMVVSQKSDVWQPYAAALTPLYMNHEQGPKLAYGLTQSIAVLDEDEFSEPNLDLWNTAWQQAGADHEDLDIALKSLDAAVEVIKTKSDRPLFRLPPEVRELIRPLLKRTLGEDE